MFGSIIPIFSKSAEHYEAIHKKVVEIEAKIGKCISEQKKKFDKNYSHHERMVKNYAN